MINLKWEDKFDELAKFNAEKDKSKFNDEYLKHMSDLQKEYDDKLRAAIKEIK